MKLSTFNKIEKWFYKVWRIMSLVLSIVLLFFLVSQINQNKYQIIVEKEVIKESSFCSIGNLYIGAIVMIGEKEFVVNDYDKYEYSSVKDTINIGLEEVNK